jgi:4-amino-4-deoxy-L-arabinose transferase-like glycosyltransferase
MSSDPPPTTAPPMAWALGTVALAVALRLVVAGRLPLVEDEAYYWVWSRHLAWGYFDHPPAIAALVAGGCAILGKTELGVRGLGVLLGGAAMLPLLRFARDPLLAAFLVAGLPLFTLGGLLATPDVPLVAGWSLGLGAALGGRWRIAGLALGLAALGKYTAWGFWPLALLACPREWRQVVQGALLALLVQVPHLAWEADHDWVTVAFQLGHGLDRPPGGALAFLGAQVGLAGPLVFVAFAAWCVAQGRVLRDWVAGRGAEPAADGGDRVDRLVLFTSLPVLLFFTWAATQGSGEANWAAPAWVGAVVALARARGWVARLAWLGAGTNLVLSALVVRHAFQPLVVVPGDPTARLGVGRDLAASVEAWGVEPVYTSRYQEAALLAWYADLDAVALPGVDRPDQYDLWPTPWAAHALFVRQRRGGLEATVDAFCADRGGENVVSEYNADGSVIERWQVYEVRRCGPRAEGTP